MFGLALSIVAAIQRFDSTVLEANKLQEQNLFHEAEKTYLRALASAAALGPQTHPYAVVLNNLGALRYRMGRYKEARADYEKAAEIWRMLDNRKDLAACLSNSAELSHAHGDDKEALRYSEEAMSLRRASGNGSPHGTTIHGNILRSLGRHKDAAQVLRNAARESLRSDPSGARSAFALTSLSQAELSLGNYEEALKATQDALNIWERLNGRQSSQYASVLSLRARAWRAQNELASAERDLRQAKEILERSLREDHPKMIPVLADLADVLGRRRRHDEAVTLLRRAQAVASANLAPSHPDHAALLLAIGDQYRAAKDADKAKEFYAQALKAAETTYGPDHPNLGSYLNNYATILHQTGRTAEAESYFRRALAARESQLGPMHIAHAETLHNLAVVCAEREEYKEARGFIERSLAIRQQYFGDGDPSLIAPLRAYSHILERSGDKKRAKAIASQADLLAASRPERRHTVDIKSLQSFR